jgi:hypothetical protein
LVDDELGSAEVVVFVTEHVGALEVAPSHILEVETPYDWHDSFTGLEDD